MNVSINIVGHKLSDWSTIHHLVNLSKYFLGLSCRPLCSELVYCCHEVIHSERFIVSKGFEMVGALLATDEAALNDIVHLLFIHVRHETWLGLASSSRGFSVVWGEIGHQRIHLCESLSLLDLSLPCILNTFKIWQFLHILITSPPDKIILEHSQVNLILIETINFTKGSHVSQIVVGWVFGVLTKELDKHI